MILRPYQRDAIAETRKRLAAGRKAPLLVAPTGSGKTVIEAEIVRLHLEHDARHRVLIVAHRRELIGQIAGTMLKMGMTSIGEIYPGAAFRRDARIQIASTQTLRARQIYPESSLNLYDEAHHYSSDDWHELTKAWPNTIRVGFTATPMRSDGRGMSPAFDSLVVVSTIKKLTAEKYLVPCRVIAPEKPLRSPNLACEPVKAYQDHAVGKRTVVFAQFVDDAYKFCAQFTEAGIDACVIHGEMSDSERKSALRRHADGSVLINVMVLTEGWDSPQTTCCILARGCGSVGTYLQIVGRVLRPCEGKKEALLIDLAGRAFHSHGDPDEDREYSLTGKGIRRKEDVETVFCPTCGSPVDEWPCEVCGYDPTGARAKPPRYTGDALAERYAGKRAEDDGKRIESLARWISESRARRWKPWSAFAKFTSVYAMAPTPEMIHKATELSKAMQCNSCVKCTKFSAKTYKGGLCGNCAFGGRTG